MQRPRQGALRRAGCAALQWVVRRDAVEHALRREAAGCYCVATSAAGSTVAFNFAICAVRLVSAFFTTTAMRSPCARVLSAIPESSGAGGTMLRDCRLPR